MVSYKEAGVDIDQGDLLVEKLKAHCPEIGGFGGLYPLGDNYLVASTDGVGTKLKLAFELDFHQSIGIDLVAMCVNDVLTAGAKPLFLLDYFATSKLDVEKAEAVLKGVISGCREAGCVLLGGETAEMPGFYNPDEYDIAGFTVGIVAKKDLIDESQIQKGDALVGIASSGIHSNGFSLVREIVKASHTSLEKIFPGTNRTLGEILITPTKIYVKKIFHLLEQFTIKGMAHITGGGLIDNVPRMFPKGKGGRINRKSWDVPPIFNWLQSMGHVKEEEMFRTFNMGIGMVAAMNPDEAQALCKLEKDCFLIGEVIEGEGVVWE